MTVNNNIRKIPRNQNTKLASVSNQGIRKLYCCAKLSTSFLLKAKFHYASWFEADSELVQAEILPII